MASPKLKIVEHRPSGLQRLVADYLAHQRSRGLSAHTADLTANVIEHAFLPWCAKEGLTMPEQLTQPVLDRWATYLLEDHRTPRGKPLARESVRTYLRTLGSFVRWAQESDAAIGAKVKTHQPMAEHKLMETLTRDEIQKMEDVASLERDKLMIRLLADTGIRLGELLGLRHGDLAEQGRERYIKVRGKGKRERLVPLQPSLYGRLRKYAERGRQANTERIFVTTRRSPKSGDFEPLAGRSVQNTIKWIAKDAGIERAVHPHLFRHSYATWALRRGMNPLQLQQILGHANLSMISTVYSHLTATDAYTAMMALMRAED
jgi:site-specific recombinase XerD